MERRTATLVLAAATLAILAPTAAAGDATAADDGAPEAYVINPVCELGPPGELVCETEASAQANVTVGPYPGPCVQVYPYSEICDGAEAGIEAEAAGSGRVHACGQADHVRACQPPPVQVDTLP